MQVKLNKELDWLQWETKNSPYLVKWEDKNRWENQESEDLEIGKGKESYESN